MIKSETPDKRPRLGSQDTLPSYNGEPLLLPEKSLHMSLQGQPSAEIVERNDVIYVKKPLSKKAKRRLKYFGIFLIVVVLLCLIFAFIIFPIIFMNSIELQRLLMFTNLGLPNDVSYFRKYELRPGLKNFYVSVKDLNGKDVVSLGAWHLLPYTLQENIITDLNFDFEEALRTTNTTILLYFHGTGEDRSSSLLKYTVFRFFFHVITFDYRSYGDSSKNVLSENAVVNDCVQLYEWLTTRTTAPIIIWGHSLGTALATHTVSVLKSRPNVTQPAGLVLEGAFTNMSEELYVHPYGKIFAWLPWFEATVIKPLEKNGFVFDNSKNILNVESPIMLLNAEDDSVVPYTFGKKLYEIAKTRSILNTTLYYQFADNLNYDHFFLYQDPFLPYFINYFWYLCVGDRFNETYQNQP